MYSKVTSEVCMYSKVASWTLVLAVLARNSELSELLRRLPTALLSCSWIRCFTLLYSALLWRLPTAFLAPAPHLCEHAQPLFRRLHPQQARWQDVQDLHTHTHTRTHTTHTATPTTSATYPRLVVSSALRPFHYASGIGYLLYSVLLCFTMLLVLDAR